METNETKAPATVSWPRKCRIHEAASPDAGRYAFNGVLLDREAGCVVATDGRIMAVVPAEYSPDFPAEAEKVIAPRSQMLEAVKGRPRGMPGARVSVARAGGVDWSVTVRTKAGEVSAAALDGVFPTYRQVVPTYGPARDMPAGTAEFVRLGINAELLLRLAKALGSENGEVILHIPLPSAPTDRRIYREGIVHGAMLAHATHSAADDLTAPFGVIMPVIFPS